MPHDTPYHASRYPFACHTTTPLRYADAKNHKSDPLSVWLPLLQKMLASLSAAEAAEAGEAEEVGEAGVSSVGVSRVASREQGSSPQMLRAGEGSPQMVRAAARQSRQARQMRRLRDLLPVGLREYDLGRLLGSDGSGGAASSGVLEREAISAEIVQALICGLARTRAYGLVIDGAGTNPHPHPHRSTFTLTLTLTFTLTFHPNPNPNPNPNLNSHPQP